MADEAQPTFVQKLNQGEQFWAWKLGLRVVICVLDIVGIGCAAWLLANAAGLEANFFDEFFTEFEWAPGALVSLSLSLIWCLICILVLLLRRPPKPVHPGVAVGLDLVLWLAFIVTALLTTAAIISIAAFGNDPDFLEDPSFGGNNYEGNYYLAANNTWVYNVTSVSSSGGYGSYGGYTFNSTTGTYSRNSTTPNIANVVRNCKPSFNTCQEQDAFINRLWHQKPRREDTEIVAGAVQWLNVLLHFVLFVWACVDTNKRNRSQKTTQEVAIASRVLQDMQARGLITVHDPAVIGGRAERQPLMSQVPDEAQAPPAQQTHISGADAT